MSNVKELLRLHEVVTDVHTVTGDLNASGVVSGAISYSIHELERPGVRSGDELLVEVKDSTEPSILIGGNNLELKVLNGAGILNTIDLKTGERGSVLLGQDEEASLSTDNILYWYKSIGHLLEPLIIRQHCEDFELKNERPLSEVVRTIGSVIGFSTYED